MSNEQRTGLHLRPGSRATATTGTRLPQDTRRHYFVSKNDNARP
ncbi:hypothetical protein FRUB_10591 [Fimbriiglobus ruber]|uniref:Uncharacterized protein n=1 Tax=Fimbriiglobus ruber TaxID=1908690 RepID=A0A225CZ12_9BACT|nr:hypothetical protein FRUB_10591 [Fimbriiglobus ruber]